MPSASAGRCPYPIHKGSTSELVKSGIKLLWNGLKYWCFERQNVVSLWRRSLRTLKDSALGTIRNGKKQIKTCAKCYVSSRLSVGLYPIYAISFDRITTPSHSKRIYLGTCQKTSVTRWKCGFKSQNVVSFWGLHPIPQGLCSCE